MSNLPVIEVENLVVEYGRGSTATRAVDGISFKVMPGECVGFIGANGAGKSTTIKTLLGFIFPRQGQVRVFGSPAGTVESRQRIGYLPEVALYYPFMKARELLELYGGLQGLGRAELKRRIPPLLEEVGLAGRGETLLKNFSKGMQQRLGIAQAIIAEPEALIFDELSSGLDPVGKFDLRQVLLKLKQAGRTIFFSSHELTEVESLCDRVIMIHKGRIVTEATVQELMKPLNEFQVVFQLPDGSPVPDSISRHKPERDGSNWRASIRDTAEYAAAVADLSQCGARIVSTSSNSRSLEDYFISLVRGTGGNA
ncbi:MAG: ABC transporter ATP-binding protein [Candidatus Sumerlaeaceae bacterium]|nr:ABC transporter ATP-binding protein [Candidatus Sumerlaeaceae bacterium]